MIRIGGVSPKHNKEGEFDGMYAKHSPKKHYEWAEKKQRKKINWKKWKWKHFHSVLTDAVWTVNWLWNAAGQHKIIYWTLQLVKLVAQYEAHTRKRSQPIYYFFPPHFFLLFYMAQKAPGLKKYTFQHGSLTYQKYAKLKKYSWKYPTGYYGWLCSVIYNSY